MSRCAPCVIDTTMCAPRSGALADEERREHLGHDAERACCEIGGLHRWQRGRRVLEQSGEADVVEIVPGALLVLAAEPEAR